MYLAPESIALNVSPWRIKVYGKYDVGLGRFPYKGLIEVAQTLTVTPRRNAIGTIEFTLLMDSPRLADLCTRGARCVFTLNGDFLMSGPVVNVKGDKDSGIETRTFTVEDDFRIFSYALGWPNPAGAINEQGAVDKYDTHNGSAENIVKQFVTANASRFYPPVTVAPNLNRGETIPGGISMRMHPLADRLFPAVDQAGIGVTVQQINGNLVVDCYEPTVRPRKLTEESGVLAKWSYTQSAPTLTRAVVGGSGEGTDREFALVSDLAREAEWGMKLEGFRDARDADDSTVMEARANESLAEGAAMIGFSIELAETDTFKYGRTLKVGDVVTVAVAPGLEVQDVVREVVITQTADEGLTVKPKVGTDEMKAVPVMARAIKRLSAKIRDLQAGV